MHRNRSSRAWPGWLLAWTALAVSAQATDPAIVSFDSAGTLTFLRCPSGETYRVECATTLTGTWTRLAVPATVDGIPTTLDCIPARNRSIVTCSVPILAASGFYRSTAELGAMATIPAGSFMMGNAFTNDPSESAAMKPQELPIHSVYVSTFEMDRYLVSLQQWRQVRTWATNSGYTDLPVGVGKGTNHPVHSVNWYDCIKWCNARSDMEGLTACYTTGGATCKTGTPTAIVCNWTANGYRLPTEAEREKAARGAVTAGRFLWADTNTISYVRSMYEAATNKYTYETTTNAYAGNFFWHPAYAVNGQPYTSPVGSFAPNGYGLYDMSGNVWQWCWDWYQSDYYTNSPATDPTGPDAPQMTRVIRGGSWLNEASAMRCSDRGDTQPTSSWSGCGFRCVRRP